ncbi:HET-domain-containing protein [Aulographum hederae CBS 113979]|uniref:HET-domain-containing protein n=1 Tax=Aulographum hederae CBS 113979 TaxID=1176131 RepID=A0A6G1H528_9PEZI|nr:HET-domain-containing protein [Aulographum hederae CBS 113979]
MRLLKLENSGEICLIERSRNDIPQYAILSHTWGPDGEEVTYDDMIKKSGEHKLGYKKIQFCGNQAKNDGLQYFWIDTCCIDKSSSAELSEAINSMFRWYQNSTKCYVYLADVSSRKRKAIDRCSESTWEPAFRDSKWFTRGWTLQELIAPRSVEFFSKEDEKLGDRKSLEQQLRDITGIPIHALRGEPLSHFNANERITWAARRITKLEEDKAYCLLGIFDVSMAAIYGEGGHRAYRRLLNEIKSHQLEQVPDARPALLSLEQAKSPTQEVWMVPFDKNSRFTGREPELARLEDMLFSKQQTTKLAITGLGGVGKTQLVIELLHRIASKQMHCSIIWISAVNMESLHQSYLDVARQLGISGCEDDKADVKRLVQQHLSKESIGRWLLVFDNADDLDMWITRIGPEQRSNPLIDYLPKSKQGAVVFTTRDRKIAVKLAQQNVVEVPAMGEDTATQLLEKCLVDPDLAKDRQETSELLLQLTYLPLAIVQAAAYINENTISLAGYLSLLAEQEEEVIDLLSEEFEDDGRYRDIKNPVATTWLISFDQIQRRDQLAADYLSFIACIEPKDIPQSLLPAGQSRKKEVDAIGTLMAYSFVNKRPADECLDLHRLVHLAIRNWLRKENLLAQSTERAILRLGEVFPDHDHQNRMAWRKYLAHAIYTLESNVASNDDDVRVSLVWKLGMCLYMDGRWNEAEKAFVRVIETRKKTRKRVLGEEHPDTLTSMNNLAFTWKEQGRNAESAKLMEDFVRLGTQVLGSHHPHILSSSETLNKWRLGNLAIDNIQT